MKKITTFALIISFIPLAVTNAAEVYYKPLVGIPGVDTTNFDSFISTLYALSISIAGLLAVIKIIWAGVKYMLTDVVTTKGEAKKDIQGALVGLLVVLSAVLILTVINPNIINVDMSLSPASNRQAAATTPSNATAPLPSIDNYSAYSAFNAVRYTKEELNAFINDCSSANNKYVFNASNGEARCYKTGEGRTMERVKFCKDLFTNCGQEEADARTKCVSDLGGEYTVDPKNTNYGICIY